MNRTIILTSLLSAAAAFAVARAQSRPAASTTPTNAKKLAQVAKDFGTTPENLAAWMQREMGDPLLVQEDLWVGINRDEAGQAKTIKITTPQLNVEFNLRPGDRPALSYYGGIGEIGKENLAITTDFDGDAKIDQIILRPQKNEARATTVLLRNADRFEPATPLGEKRFRLPDGRAVAFDLAAREWVDSPPPTTRPGG